MSYTVVVIVVPLAAILVTVVGFIIWKKTKGKNNIFILNLINNFYYKYKQDSLFSGRKTKKDENMVSFRADTTDRSKSGLNKLNG